MKKEAFIANIRRKAEQKVKELRELEHELKRLDLTLVRTQEYIDQLNDFAKKIKSGYFDSNTIPGI